MKCSMRALWFTAIVFLDRAISSPATAPPPPTLTPIYYAQTDLLNIAYHDSGPRNGSVVVLVHGFPYGINVYAEVVTQLHDDGFRTVVPYLRGYGSTTFRDSDTPRDSQPAALGRDLVDLLDALSIERAIVAGFDWGTVAVNVVAALWPQRVTAMVAVNSYLIQDRASAYVPAPPAAEALRWYFYLLLTPRGFAGIAQYPEAWLRSLWSKNSPQWNYTQQDVDRILPAILNPDFPEISANFYRRALLYYSGDPRYHDDAMLLDTVPEIQVPSVTIDPEFSPVIPPQNASFAASHFTGPRIHRIIADTGENIPQQNPQAFIDAVRDAAKLAHL